MNTSGHSLPSTLARNYVSCKQHRDQKFGVPFLVHCIVQLRSIGLGRNRFTCGKWIKDPESRTARAMDGCLCMGAWRHGKGRSRGQATSIGQGTTSKRQEAKGGCEGMLEESAMQAQRRIEQARAGMPRIKMHFKKT